MKVALVVTARMRSSRLERKMTADLGGRGALEYLLLRLRAARAPDLRIVCTTVDAEDARIAEIAARSGWLSFRGDEEDLLRRYADAARLHGIDFLVNVDGDDLFCATEEVDAMACRARAGGVDFLSAEGLPFGGAPVGVAAEALFDVCGWKRERETQGWGKYFTRSGRYRTETRVAPPALRRPDYRMTLDYPEDLEFFRTVAARLDPALSGALSLFEVVRFLDAHPAVAAMSAAVTERYWERFRAQHGAFAGEASR